MTISSRTPEGEPASCPLCLANIVIEPSVLIGDATCPKCGHLLWFFQTSEVTRIFDAKTKPAEKDRVVDYIAAQLGIDRQNIDNNPDFLHEAAADSLDTVELVMALEEEFDLS